MVELYLHSPMRLHDIQMFSLTLLLMLSPTHVKHNMEIEPEHIYLHILYETLFASQRLQMW
jgi:hypothetical protein